MNDYTTTDLTLFINEKDNQKKEKRPSWDEYFMEIAEIVKKRSTCLRRQVGSVLVRDKRILSTGYNGAPLGCSHCSETGCLREQLNIPSGERHELCKASHSEQNAICQAAYSGVSTKGATIYVTCQPCSICTKMIINAGIEKIVYKGDYPDKLSLDLIKESGIRKIVFNKKNYEEWMRND